MTKKPVLLLTFAANDLPEVRAEADKIEKIMTNHGLINAVRLEDVEITELTDSIFDHQEDLFFFHFGGHSSNEGLTLNDNYYLDKNKLAQLLINDDHCLQWVFLNGCESKGHVGALTANGVKAVIATNNQIDSKKGAQIAKYFYKFFLAINILLAKLLKKQMQQ